jgi:hypothetical protein
MCKFHDEIPVRNFFTVIFHICLCNNQFRRKLANRDVPAWWAGGSREWAAGGRGQGQSRDISPIVPQREQKITTGARQSTREWPGTPHLQHKDSGRGSRVAWGPRPYGLSSTHSSYSTPSQTSSGMSLAIWAGTGVRAGAVSSAVLWLLAVVPWGFSWGLPGWGVPGGGCPVGVAGRGTDGWAAGWGPDCPLRRGRRLPRPPPSTPSPAGGPWCGLSWATEVPADRRV